MLPAKLLLPAATYNAYKFPEATILVPLVGAFAIYNVDKLLYVTEALLAAIVGIPIACAAASATVVLAAATLSVYVLASNLRPKLTVGVLTLALPDAVPETVCELPYITPVILAPVSVTVTILATLFAEIFTVVELVITLLLVPVDIDV
jgi:hypothetical protein